MSVLLNKDSRVVTQGMGATGKFHLQGCREYGTQMVAGVRPGKGGSDFEGCPVFDTVAQSVEKEGANVAVIYVPPPGAADAIMEATDAGVPLIVCITEGIPSADMVRVKRFMEGKSSRLIGRQLIDDFSRGRDHRGRAGRRAAQEIAFVLNRSKNSQSQVLL